MTGLRNNNSANLRTQATMLAAEFGDILRSNLEEVDKNTFGTEVDDGNEYSSSTPGLVVANCEQVSGDCSSAEMAQTARANWSADVVAQLPSGVATTNRIGTIYTVTLTWLDDKSNDATVDFVSSFQP
ncbi:MAG: hypothetical protein GY829_14800 [Gammaproteobacteria bacterium]|nr:hypothetical protein [Gammaproteobacteria bacterium]